MDCDFIIQCKMKENEEMRLCSLEWRDQMSKLHLHKLTECFHFKRELAKFLLNASLENHRKVRTAK